MSTDTELDASVRRVLLGILSEGEPYTGIPLVDPESNLLAPPIVAAIRGPLEEALTELDADVATLGGTQIEHTASIEALDTLTTSGRLSEAQQSATTAAQIAAEAPAVVAPVIASAAAQSFRSAAAEVRHGLATSQDRVIAVLGDSTGNASDEWVYLASDAFAADYPNVACSYRAWNDGTQGYDAAVSIQTGIAGPGDSVVRDSGIAVTQGGALMYQRSHRIDPRTAPGLRVVTRISITGSAPATGIRFGLIGNATDEIYASVSRNASSWAISVAERVSGSAVTIAPQTVGVASDSTSRIFDVTADIVGQSVSATIQLLDGSGNPVPGSVATTTGTISQSLTAWAPFTGSTLWQLRATGVGTLSGINLARVSIGTTASPGSVFSDIFPPSMPLGGTVLDVRGHSIAPLNTLGLRATAEVSLPANYTGTVDLFPFGNRTSSGGNNAYVRLSIVAGKYRASIIERISGTATVLGATLADIGDSTVAQSVRVQWTNLLKAVTVTLTTGFESELDAIPNATTSGTGTLTSADAWSVFTDAAVRYAGVEASVAGASLTFIEAGPRDIPAATLRVWNGSMPGASLSYHRARLAAMLPEAPNLLILSSSHNHAEQTAAEYLAELDTTIAQARALYPSALIGVAISSQNPKFSGSIQAHLARLRAIPAYAAERGYGYIGALEAFYAQADRGKSWTQSDGTHPDVTNGEPAWRDKALVYLRG